MYLKASCRCLGPLPWTMRGLLEIGRGGLIKKRSRRDNRSQGRREKRSEVSQRFTMFLISCGSFSSAGLCCSCDKWLADEVATGGTLRCRCLNTALTCVTRGLIIPRGGTICI